MRLDDEGRARVEQMRWVVLRLDGPLLPGVGQHVWPHDRWAEVGVATRGQTAAHDLYQLLHCPSGGDAD